MKDNPVSQEGLYQVLGRTRAVSVTFSIQNISETYTFFNCILPSNLWKFKNIARQGHVYLKIVLRFSGMSKKNMTKQENKK